MNTYGYVGASSLLRTDSQGLFDSARMACARNPAFCAEISTLPKPVPRPKAPVVPIPSDKANKDENCDDDYEYCVEQWINDTQWCDRSFTGRKNIACRAWAAEELARCKKGSPRQPFRL